MDVLAEMHLLLRAHGWKPEHGSRVAGSPVPLAMVMASIDADHEVPDSWLWRRPRVRWQFSTWKAGHYKERSGAVHGWAMRCMALNLAGPRDPRWGLPPKRVFRSPRALAKFLKQLASTK